MMTTPRNWSWYLNSRRHEGDRDAFDRALVRDEDESGCRGRVFLWDGEELDRQVKNNKTASGSDRTVAFVQGQRYVSFSKLRENPEYTTELEDSD